MPDLGGHPGMRPPTAKIFSISCSFSQNLAKSYVGASPGRLAPPRTGNPGSTPDTESIMNMDIEFVSWNT